jgi:competence protein ComEA
MDKLNRFWLIITGAVVLLIIASCIIIGLHRDNGQPIEITSSEPPIFQGEINIDGAVINPGSYPVKTGDSIDEILQISGVDKKNADVSNMYLYVPRINETFVSQKVDINRADPWLLQALPNIGESRAEAICNYRLQNGSFHNIEEITKVPGITGQTFEKMKDLITVAEYH